MIRRWTTAAFLDDAPLEERRSRAVRTDMRPVDDDALLPDASVVDQVRADSRPAPRDISELYDLLTTFGILPEEELTELNHPDWTGRLYDEERLQTFTRDGRRFIVPADRFGHAGLLFGTRAETPPGLTYERALDDVLRGHLELRGPMDVGTLSRFTSLEESVIDQAFLRYENEGWLFRTKSNGNVLWCERSFWQRMQHYRRRYGGHPVTFTPEQYLSFLVRWQHAHPDTRLEGPGGVEKALSLLEGCSMSVDSWHKVLERRVDGFQQSFLDHLILTGAYVWWRPARESDAGRRSITRHTPVMILSRELLKVLEVPEAPALSHYAQS
ncbi:MAG: hypothetical protein HY042_01435, partial [Spirochaetia bacterium]|nr:hypothetical protein [Spirochaetia bacterium]